VTDFLQDHPNGLILAMDQMSLYFQATLTRVWAAVGQTPVVAVHPQRDHVHFYGALNIRDGREIALPASETTSEMTANFVMLLLMLYPQPILLLLDRAPWHLGAVSDLIAKTDQQLTLDALDMALTQVTQFIFHSDQGSQYAAWSHTERLLNEDVHISMSDKARPTQNGLVERFMRTVKEEHVDYSEYRDFEDAYQQLKHWLEVVYMTERIHESLHYVTPAEFETAALTMGYPLLNPA